MYNSARCDELSFVSSPYRSIKLLAALITNILVLIIIYAASWYVYLTRLYFC